MSLYKEFGIDIALKRIQTKIETDNNELSFRSLKTLSENDIRLFECKYEIMLPIAYRRFIKEISDGGVFTDKNGFTYKLLSLPEIKVEIELIKKPFPLVNFWIWENDDYENNSEYKELFKNVRNGSLMFMDKGCGGSFDLIVTGQCIGEVWDFTDVGAQSLLYPRRDFLSWFEFFLDNGDRFYEAFPDYTAFEHLNRS